MSAEYDGKSIGTVGDLVPKVIDDTPRAKAREHL